MALMQALNERKTVRAYKSDELSNQQVSDLLWSANGINRKDGKRTAPSAVNRQEIDLYLITSKAVFKYDPQANVLEKVKDGDFRKWAGKFKAPVYVALVADLKKAVSADYAKVDAGYVSQNIYLAAQSLGLGTCAMARIADRAALARELELGNNLLLLVHPLGAPEK